MTSTSHKVLKQFIQLFPPKISFAFAYGSGVFNQSLRTGVHLNNENKDRDVIKEVIRENSTNMIDLILVVDNSVEWHKENLLRNGWHYSWLKHFGPKWLSTIQESFGAKVYFNTLIPVENNLIKYGVINTEHLINDLLDWDTLYISGRLHKPVRVLNEAIADSALERALHINVKSALHAALLMLPETFTEQWLYRTIAGISYLGDFRMIFGEDKQKVEKIVAPQIDEFRRIYQPMISSESMENFLEWNQYAKTYTQDCSSRVILHHLNLMPKNIQDILYIEWQQNGRLRDIDDVLRSLSQSFVCDTYVVKAITNVVSSSSVSQTFKSFFTAGFIKSVRYSSLKLLKMFKSLKLKNIKFKWK